MRSGSERSIGVAVLLGLGLATTLGCTEGSGGGTGGSGTGGVAGSATTAGAGGESSGSTTGGAATGGTSSGGTGGSSESTTSIVTTGGTGPYPSECTFKPRRVVACLFSDSLPAIPTPPIDITVNGTVTAVRSPVDGEDCTLAGYGYQIAKAALPEVVIDLDPGDGTTWSVGISVPGFSQASVAVGQSLVVQYNFEHFMFDPPFGKLTIERDGLFLAGAGDGWPVGVSIEQGPPECLWNDGFCDRTGHELHVTGPDGSSAYVFRGDSAYAGPLLVTNDEMMVFSGGNNCEAPNGSVELVMGTARP